MHTTLRTLHFLQGSRMDIGGSISLSGDATDSVSNVPLLAGVAVSDGNAEPVHPVQAPSDFAALLERLKLLSETTSEQLTTAVPGLTASETADAVAVVPVEGDDEDVLAVDNSWFNRQPAVIPTVELEESTATPPLLPGEPAISAETEGLTIQSSSDLSETNAVVPTVDPAPQPGRIDRPVETTESPAHLDSDLTGQNRFAVPSGEWEPPNTNGEERIVATPPVSANQQVVAGDSQLQLTDEVHGQAGSGRPAADRTSLPIQHSDTAETTLQSAAPANPANPEDVQASQATAAGVNKPSQPKSPSTGLEKAVASEPADSAIVTGANGEVSSHAQGAEAVKGEALAKNIQNSADVSAAAITPKSHGQTDEGGDASPQQDLAHHDLAHHDLSTQELPTLVPGDVIDVQSAADASTSTVSRPPTAPASAGVETADLTAVKPNAYAVALDSPELGKVMLQVSERQGIHAHLIVQSEAAYQTIANEVPQVAKAVSEVGVTLSEFSLEQSDGSADQAPSDARREGEGTRREHPGQETTSRSKKSVSMANRKFQRLSTSMTPPVASRLDVLI